MHAIAIELLLLLPQATPFQEAPAQPKSAAPGVSIQADKSGRYVEFYDVRDLALPSRLRLLARAGAEPAVAPAAESPAEEVEQQRDTWRLLTALLQCVGARLDDGFECEAKDSGALIVRTTQKGHDRVAALLNTLRDATKWAVTVEFRMLELDAAQRQLLVELENKDAKDDPLAAAQITQVAPATLERLLAAGASVMAAPSITSFELDPFDVRIGSEIAYVSGFDLVAIEGLGKIADPVIKTLFEGISITGRVVAAPGMAPKETPFALRLEVETAVLKRPIPTAKCDAGTIQLPETRQATIQTTVAGTIGGTFLVGGVPKPSFDEPDADRRIYVLVKVIGPADTGR